MIEFDFAVVVVLLVPFEDVGDLVHFVEELFVLVR